MRQLFSRGLAIAASLAFLSPAMAQQTYDPISTRYNSVLSDINSTPARAIGFFRPSQDATPSTLAAPAPVAPAPVTSTLAQASGGECGTAGGCDYGNYFDGNAESCAPARSANWVGGVYGLAFRRDYEDDKGLSAIPSNLSQYLNSTSAKMGTMGGLEAVLARRGCDGNGFEVRYWGLYPDTADAGLAGSPYTNLTGLSQVEFGGFPVSQIYNRSATHFVYRDNTIHNFEFNLLRSLGTTDCGKRNWEWLAGFRYLSFDESLRYATFTQNANYPPNFFYDNCAHNDLFGFQVGARSERCLKNRFGYQFGTKIGIYGNHIEACQSIHDGNQAFAEISSGPYAARDYAFESSKDDVSMMGELNLGLTYQLKCNWRAIAGYRVLGVSGIALAPDQIPINFTDAQDIARIKSNGSLILHGSYFGVERSF